MKTSFPVAFLFVMLIQTSWAQDFDSLDLYREIELEEIEIFGNRFQTTYDNKIKNIEVLSKKELNLLPAQSLPEVLNYLPGVDIRQRGPVGVQGDVSILGGGFEQALVLVNGIKMNDPQTGHHNLNVPVNLNNIKQIEVIKGPGARIYGQNAFTGAINIVTDIPDKRLIDLNGYYGTWGSIGYNVGVSLPVGNYKQYLSYSRDQSDGYRKNTDYDLSNLYYEGELKFSDNQSLKLMAAHMSRDFGANGFYAFPTDSNQYEEVKTNLVNITHKIESAFIKNTFRAYFRNNRDSYIFHKENPQWYHNIHTTWVTGIENHAVFKSLLGSTGVGVEVRNERIIGTNKTEGGDTDLGFRERQNYGLYLEHSFLLAQNKLEIVPGFHYNHYSTFGSALLPGIDIGYNLSPYVKIYANAGMTYRIPTFFDLYYQSPAEIGNPDLVPEEAITYEAGISYLKNGINIESTVFVRNGTNIIDWENVPLNDSTFIWQSSNLSDVTTTGAEFSVKLFPQVFAKSWKVLPVRQLYASYVWLDQEVENKGGVESRYALTGLTNQFIFGVDQKLFRSLTYNLNVRYVDRQGEIRINRSGDILQREPYWLLDIRLNYALTQNMNFYLEATNLLDNEYVEVQTPMPGRWVRAGFKMDIQY